MSAVQQAVTRQALPAIGSPLGGGFFTGVLIQDGKRYAVITAPAAAELEGEWGEYGEHVEGADSFTESRANTEAMAAAGSDLAQRVLGLQIGGYSDWAIPARDAQELQYRYFKPTTDRNWAGRRDGDNPSSEPVGQLYSEESPAQTAHEAFKEGGDQAFKPQWYWSSSQRSAYYAFTMDFEAGYQDFHDEFNELRVRPVRSVLID